MNCRWFLMPSKCFRAILTFSVVVLRRDENPGHHYPSEGFLWKVSGLMIYALEIILGQTILPQPDLQQREGSGYVHVSPIVRRYVLS
jgi:hypothetical protein